MVGPRVSRDFLLASHCCRCFSVEVCEQSVSPPVQLAKTPARPIIKNRAECGFMTFPSPFHWCCWYVCRAALFCGGVMGNLLFCFDVGENSFSCSNNILLC